LLLDAVYNIMQFNLFGDQKNIQNGMVRSNIALVNLVKNTILCLLRNTHCVLPVLFPLVANFLPIFIAEYKIYITDHKRSRITCHNIIYSNRCETMFQCQQLTFALMLHFLFLLCDKQSNKRIRLCYLRSR